MEAEQSNPEQLVAQEEINEDISNFPETYHNENTTLQPMDAAKTTLQGNFNQRLHHKIEMSPTTYHCTSRN